MLKFLKSFLFSKDKFQPAYFWITVFCILAVTMFILRLLEFKNFSDTLILGVLGFIIAWLGVYNWYKIKGPETMEEQPIDFEPKEMIKDAVKKIKKNS